MTMNEEFTLMALGDRLFSSNTLEHLLGYMQASVDMSIGLESFEFFMLLEGAVYEAKHRIQESIWRHPTPGS